METEEDLEEETEEEIEEDLEVETEEVSEVEIEEVSVEETEVVSEEDKEEDLTTTDPPQSTSAEMTKMPRRELSASSRERE